MSDELMINGTTLRASKVDADQLRALFLKINAKRSEPAIHVGMIRHRGPLAAIVFQNLEIRGDFVLPDSSEAPEVGFLGIVFRQCQIHGSIRLGRVRLLRFAVEHCTFTNAGRGCEISARQSVFDTSVLLDHLMPAPASSLRAAFPHCQFGGDLIVRATTLCSVPINDTQELATDRGFPKQFPGPYALDITNSTFAGSVFLRSWLDERAPEPHVCRTRLFGGLNFSAATIAGDLNAAGALFVRPYGEAIRGQAAHISGLAWMQSRPPLLDHSPSADLDSYQRFVCIGCVWLLHIVIDGSLTMDGAYIDSGDKECSLNIQNAVIGSNVRLTYYKGGWGALEKKQEPTLFQTSGPVWMLDARLGARIELLGADIGFSLPRREIERTEATSLNCRNMQTESDVEISGTFTGTVDFTGAQIGGNLTFYQRDKYDPDATYVAFRLAPSAGPRLAPALLRINRAVVRGSLGVHRISVLEESREICDPARAQSLNGTLPVIHITATKVRFLDDANGTNWFRRANDTVPALVDHGLPPFRLQLDGFEPDFLSSSSASGDITQWRLRWLSLQYSRRRGILHRGLMYAMPAKDEFTPTPFIEVGRRLYSEGYAHAAIRTEMARKYVATEARWIDRPRLGAAVRIVDFLFPYMMFHYFLSLFRALVTLTVYVACGACLFATLDANGFLSASVMPSAPAISTDGQQVRMLVVKDGEVKEPPCNLGGYFPVYALDKSIPLLNLGYDNKCEVRSLSKPELDKASFLKRHGYQVVSVLDALYTVFGWVIVSLVVLTASGITRSRVSS